MTTTRRLDRLTSEVIRVIESAIAGPERRLEEIEAQATELRRRLDELEARTLNIEAADAARAVPNVR